MRLKTKIILICCISTLVSSAICSAAAYRLVKKSFLDAAEGHGIQAAAAIFLKLEDRITTLCGSKAGAADEQVLKYVFKQQNDEMLVCFGIKEDGGYEIYNSTIFGQTDLEDLQYQSVDGFAMDVAEMQWEGSYFYVYRQTTSSIYDAYRLEDITYVWDRMRLLGLGLVLLTGAVMAVVSLMIVAALNKILLPLQKLKEGAEQIARGRYDERIAVERRDEIGELSDDFNRMADAVQERIERLEEAEWKRTLFMGNLTHELKTPMTAISGYAKTLLAVKLPEEDKEEALSYIYEESCRLERLSKKMMDLLLLEGNAPANLVEVPAHVLFHNAEEACSRSLKEDGICLECHEDGESYPVDADLFTEVLINLVDNARKASTRGGKIILSAVGDTIEVTDFGKGIPEEEKEKILEPFYMIDKSRSRKSGGAGLGLAITAAILKQHNCRLEIESRVGEGTRMILQFV